MPQFATACVAALAVFLTSGYALGGARRRKALRELLEIRGTLPPETVPAAGAAATASRAEQIDALVDRELKALTALGDTQKRWLKAAGCTILALAGTAYIAWAALSFVPDDLENMVRYTAASALFLSGLVMIAVFPYFLSKAKWWGVPVVTFAALLALGVVLVLTVALIDGTPYSDMVLNK